MLEWRLDSILEWMQYNEVVPEKYKKEVNALIWKFI
jgi:hypothetical protein